MSTDNPKMNELTIDEIQLYDNLNLEQIKKIEDIEALAKIEKYMKEKGLTEFAQVASDRLDELTSQDLQEATFEMATELEDFQRTAASSDAELRQEQLTRKSGQIPSSRQSYRGSNDLEGSNLIEEVQSPTDQAQRLREINSDMTTAQQRVVAEEKRQSGNECYRAGEYPEALALYTEGLAFQPSALLHNNRAAVLMHMQRYQEAEADATAALQMQPSMVKALLRRAAIRLKIAAKDDSRVADIAEGALQDCLTAIQLGCEQSEVSKLKQDAERLVGRPTGRKVVIIEESDSSEDENNLEDATTPQDNLSSAEPIPHANGTIPTSSEVSSSTEESGNRIERVSTQGSVWQNILGTNVVRVPIEEGSDSSSDDDDVVAPNQEATVERSIPAEVEQNDEQAHEAQLPPTPDIHNSGNGGEGKWQGELDVSGQEQTSVDQTISSISYEHSKHTLNDSPKQVTTPSQQPYDRRAFDQEEASNVDSCDSSISALREQVQAAYASQQASQQTATSAHTDKLGKELLLNKLATQYETLAGQRNDLLQKARSLQQSNEQGPREEALQLKAEGNELFKANMYTEAQAKFQKALDLQQAEQTLYHNIAQCLRRQGKMEDALRYMQISTALDPDYANALLRKGEILYELGNPRSAAQVLARASQAGQEQGMRSIETSAQKVRKQALEQVESLMERKKQASELTIVDNTDHGSGRIIEEVTQDNAQLEQIEKEEIRIQEIDSLEAETWNQAVKLVEQLRAKQKQVTLEYDSAIEEQRQVREKVEEMDKIMAQLQNSLEGAQSAAESARKQEAEAQADLSTRSQRLSQLQNDLAEAIAAAENEAKIQKKEAQQLEEKLMQAKLQEAEKQKAIQEEAELQNSAQNKAQQHSAPQHEQRQQEASNQNADIQKYKQDDTQQIPTCKQDGEQFESQQQFGLQKKLLAEDQSTSEKDEKEQPNEDYDSRQQLDLLIRLQHNKSAADQEYRDQRFHEAMCVYRTCLNDLEEHLQELYKAETFERDSSRIQECQELRGKLLVNHAASAASLQDWEELLKDAEDLVEYPEKRDKAFYRMGQALRGLGRLEEARKALLKATGNCKEEFKSKLIAELAHVDRLMAEEETKKVQGSQNETRDIAKQQLRISCVDSDSTKDVDLPSDQLDSSISQSTREVQQSKTPDTSIQEGRLPDSSGNGRSVDDTFVSRRDNNDSVYDGGDNVGKLGVEELRKSEQLREEGNQKYKEGDFPGAIEFYSRALQINSQDFFALSNRSQCYLKLGEPRAALQDVEKALAYKPNFDKAWHRQAQAQLELNMLEEARYSFIRLNELNPTINIDKFLDLIDQKQEENPQRQPSMSLNTPTSSDSTTSDAFLNNPPPPFIAGPPVQVLAPSPIAPDCTVFNVPLVIHDQEQQQIYHQQVGGTLRPQVELQQYKNQPDGSTMPPGRLQYPVNAFEQQGNQWVACSPQVGGYSPGSAETASMPSLMSPELSSTQISPSPASVAQEGFGVQGVGGKGGGDSGVVDGVVKSPSELQPVGEAVVDAHVANSVEEDGDDDGDGVVEDQENEAENMDPGDVQQTPPQVEMERSVGQSCGDMFGASDVVNDTQHSKVVNTSPQRDSNVLQERSTNVVGWSGGKTSPSTIEQTIKQVSKLNSAEEKANVVLNIPPQTYTQHFKEQLSTTALDQWIEALQGGMQQGRHEEVAHALQALLGVRRYVIIAKMGSIKHKSAMRGLVDQLATKGFTIQLPEMYQVNSGVTSSTQQI